MSKLGGRGHGRGEDVLVPIIGEIRPLFEFAQDGIWLDGKVDLEADMVCNLVSLPCCVVGAAGEGDDGDEVQELGPVLLVVDETCLTFFIRYGCLFHLCDRRMRSVKTFLSRDDIAVRGLQKATVLPKYFMLSVPRQGDETRGSVNDGGIVPPNVDDDE